MKVSAAGKRQHAGEPAQPLVTRRETTLSFDENAEMLEES